MDFLKEVGDKDDGEGYKNSSGSNSRAAGGGGGKSVTDSAPFFIKRSSMKFVKSLGGTMTLSEVDREMVAFKVRRESSNCAGWGL